MENRRIFQERFGHCAFPKLCKNFSVLRLNPSKILGVAACLVVTLTGACAPHDRLVNNPMRADGKSDSFGYRKWISKEVEQDVVIIGIHGFCGASIDYANLGNHLLQYQPKTGLYAYEVRGQGSDPIRDRRGDIGDPEDWYRDLFAFTLLVREQHPHAKVVWFGESISEFAPVSSLLISPAYRL